MMLTDGASRTCYRCKKKYYKQSPTNRKWYLPARYRGVDL